MIALVILPILLARRRGQGFGFALLVTAVKVAALVAFTAIVGTRIIPRLLDHVAGTRSRELFTLTVLVLALGIAVGSAVVFSVSMALGAFLAGLVVGRPSMAAGGIRSAAAARCVRRAVLRVGGDAARSRDFSNPGARRRDARHRVDRQAARRLFIIWIMRYPFATGLTVAVALAQIGEFSFMLSRVGDDLGLLTGGHQRARRCRHRLDRPESDPVPPIKPLDGWTRAHPRLRRLVDRSRGADAERAPSRVDPAHRAIVVGYGPTGRTVTRLLRENGIEPTVIDMNVDTVRELREQGVRAVYGDATHRDTLAEAGAASRQPDPDAAGMTDGREAIRHAKELNPPSTCWRARRICATCRRCGRGRRDGRFRAKARCAGADRDDPASARRDARSDRSRARARQIGAAARQP